MIDTIGCRQTMERGLRSQSPCTGRHGLGTALAPLPALLRELAVVHLANAYMRSI